MTEIIVAAIFAGLLVFLALTVPASGPRLEGERLAVATPDDFDIDAFDRAGITKLHGGAQ